MKKIFVLLSFLAHALVSSDPISAEIRSSKFGGDILGSPVPLLVEGENGEAWNATGFTVKYSSSGINYEYLVTAKHVVTGNNPNSYGRNITVYFNRNLNTHDIKSGVHNVVGYKLSIATFSSVQNVAFPDDPIVDIAVMRLLTSTKTEEEIQQEADGYSNSSATDHENIVWRANLSIRVPELIAENVKPDEIREVYFSGYPFGVNLHKWMYPIMRSCVVASPSTEGYASHNYGPYAFLIDCAPIPGDSGSAVFTREFVYADNGDLKAVRRELLGVISKEVTLDNMLQTSSRYVEKAEIVRTKLQLGVVYPAHFIMEAIRKLNEVDK